MTLVKLIRRSKKKILIIWELKPSSDLSRLSESDCNKGDEIKADSPRRWVRISFVHLSLFFLPTNYGENPFLFPSSQRFWYVSQARFPCQCGSSFFFFFCLGTDHTKISAGMATGDYFFILRLCTYMVLVRNIPCFNFKVNRRTIYKMRSFLPNTVVSFKIFYVAMSFLLRC